MRVQNIILGIFLENNFIQIINYKVLAGVIGDANLRKFLYPAIYKTKL